LERLAARVVPVYEGSVGWRERIRAGLVELLAFLEEDRSTGQLLVVETLGLGNEVLRRRARVVSYAIAALGEGRAGVEVSRLTGEGVVGAVLSVLHARLLEEGDASLLELANPLMGMIALPYLGPAAARRELSREAPTPPSRPPKGTSQLRRLETRLTYRTVRVLQAVAASPGGSNRVVGELAGIGDQGQISKLLSRLQRLGLVSNGETQPGRGTPNAWRLTERGEEVSGALARA
jgi:hypothetical protein